MSGLGSPFARRHYRAAKRPNIGPAACSGETLVRCKIFARTCKKTLQKTLRGPNLFPVFLSKTTTRLSGGRPAAEVSYGLKA